MDIIDRMGDTEIWLLDGVEIERSRDGSWSYRFQTFPKWWGEVLSQKRHSYFNVTDPYKWMKYSVDIVFGDYTP